MRSPAGEMRYGALSVENPTGCASVITPSFASVAYCSVPAWVTAASNWLRNAAVVLPGEKATLDDSTLAPTSCPWYVPGPDAGGVTVLLVIAPVAPMRAKTRLTRLGLAGV